MKGLDSKEIVAGVSFRCEFQKKNSLWGHAVISFLISTVHCHPCTLLKLSLFSSLFLQLWSQQLVSLFYHNMD